jgi:hypothetical protein
MGEDENTEPMPAGVQLDDNFREALDELEVYLEGRDLDELAALVLPLASRWIVTEAGFDITRLYGETDVLVKSQPLSDKILANYTRDLAYWVGQRMLLDADDVEQPALAQEHLAAAREALRERVQLTRAEGFPAVAAGFERVLSDSTGTPPQDALWKAMALRIAEAVHEADMRAGRSG